MRKIVLAVEDGDFSAAAIDTIQRQFGTADAEIYLFHATDPLIYLPLYEGLARDNRRAELAREKDLKEAQSLIEQTAKPLREAGYRVNTAIEEGEPRTAVVDYSERVKADLIVVGSHGRRGLARLLLGSVSEYVARHAPCSVEIVRPLPRAA